MKTLAETLRDSNSMLYVACAGAGANFINSIWSTPGCSAYFAGARLLYAKSDLHDFLGHANTEKAVCAWPALELAMESYIRAQSCSPDKSPVGLGITAAVATNRKRRGEDEAYICVITRDRIIPLSLGFDKSDSRTVQDKEITENVTKFLITCIEKPDYFVEDRESARGLLLQHPVFTAQGTRLRHSGNHCLFFPATLNPLHDGHRTLCRSAEALKGDENATYLVCSSSPHKGQMPVQQMLDIVAQVRAERWRSDYVPRAVEFTDTEPLYIDMARKRPGSLFVIGADAMQRMLDPKWGPNVEDMLNEMRNLGITFLVRGRMIGDKFVECRDIPVPFPYQLLFRPLPGRCDMSSTEVRNATA